MRRTAVTSTVQATAATADMRVIPLEALRRAHSGSRAATTDMPISAERKLTMNDTDVPNQEVAAAPSARRVKARRRLLAAAMTVATVGGGSVAAGAPADAATAACGPRCISVFSSELGTYADVSFVEAVLGGGAAQPGQPVGLAPVSGTDPSQDFLPGGATGGGTVSHFYADGMVSAEANRHYGHLGAVQQKYAPFGVETGLCVGVPRVAQNTGLSLQPCDVPGTTVWIVHPSAGTSPYFAIVNAATTDFRRPFAMHLPRNEVASGEPLQMQLRRLQYHTGEETLPARQLWGAVFGPQG